MRVSVDRLRPGMILSRDIVQGGRILLKEKAVLSEVTIRVLKKRRIVCVDVEYEEGFEDQGSNAEIGIEDPEYASKREEIENLFSTVPEDDNQMQILKYCLVRQLQEVYGD